MNIEKIGHDLFKENASKINDLDSAFNVLKEFFKAEKLGELKKSIRKKKMKNSGFTCSSLWQLQAYLNQECRWLFLKKELFRHFFHLFPEKKLT